MNNNNKQQIVANIKAYQSRKGLSQNKTADKLGISPATLSAIYDTDKWGQLSPQMWNEVDTRLASITNAQSGWQIRETDNFSTIKAIVKTAEQTGGLYCVTGETGLGKTVTLKALAQEPNHHYVLCEYLMQPRQLLAAICRGLDVEYVGKPQVLLDNICRFFQQKRQQVLLLDDVGKLPNECYRVIQLIYDKLGERCGIVLTGTNYLKQHLLKCAAADKMSFRELVRRIRNKEWGLLKKPSPKEIATFFDAVTAGDAIEKQERTACVKYLATVCTEYQRLRDVLLDALRIANANKTTITLSVLEQVNSISLTA